MKPEDLKDYIGLPVFSKSKMYGSLPPAGIMIGLAYNAYGGNILFIETIKYNFDKEQLKRKGNLKLTGSLGDVM